MSEQASPEQPHDRRSAPGIRIESLVEHEPAPTPDAAEPQTSPYQLYASIKPRNSIQWECNWGCAPSRLMIGKDIFDPLRGSLTGWAS